MLQDEPQEMVINCYIAGSKQHKKEMDATSSSTATAFLKSKEVLPPVVVESPDVATPSLSKTSQSSGRSSVSGVCSTVPESPLIKQDEGEEGERGGEEENSELPGSSPSQEDFAADSEGGTVSGGGSGSFTASLPLVTKPTCRTSLPELMAQNYVAAATLNQDADASTSSTTTVVAAASVADEPATVVTKKLLFEDNSSSTCAVDKELAASSNRNRSRGLFRSVSSSDLSETDWQDQDLLPQR